MAKRRGNAAGAAEPSAARAGAANDPASAALQRARAAMARGAFREARASARQALAAQPGDAARAEAEQILRDTSPDPMALAVAALVLTAIAIATWAALLHHH